MNDIIMTRAQSKTKRGRRLNTFSRDSVIGATIELFRRDREANGPSVPIHYTTIAALLRQQGGQISNDKSFGNYLYKLARQGRVFRLTIYPGMFELRKKWYDAKRFPLREAKVKAEPEP